MNDIIDSAFFFTTSVNYISFSTADQAMSGQTLCVGKTGLILWSQSGKIPINLRKSPEGVTNEDQYIKCPFMICWVFYEGVNIVLLESICM